MSQFQDSDSPLEPIWATAAGSVASLISQWPCTNIYNQFNQGAGWFVLAIYIPIAFFIAFAISGLVLGLLMTWFKSTLIRLLICLIPTAAFLAFRGFPGVFGLLVIGFMTVLGYIQCQRNYTDSQDRAEFFDE
jgi:cytochrome b subunit of formate dehydrogenase